MLWEKKLSQALHSSMIALDPSVVSTILCFRALQKSVDICINLDDCSVRESGAHEATNA